MTTRYDVRVRISYAYPNVASTSRQLVRLRPAERPGLQRLIASHLTIDPRPAEWVSRTDFFGNPVTEVAFVAAHRELSFDLRSRVEIADRSGGLDISPRLDALGAQVMGERSLDPGSPHHFTAWSKRAPLHPETKVYAEDVVPSGASALSAIEAVGEALHEDMTFDSTATTVDTAMIDAFRNRHGVCQDFTHIMISALRGIGVPAGYVSGLLRTDPPPGRPRLDGADAMHAWVMAWCGSDVGWVEYDPTNAVFAGSDHIVVARGRDFSDVSPVRGSLRSSGEHSSSQKVDVVPVK